MPGPRNSRKTKKSQQKKTKGRVTKMQEDDIFSQIKLVPEEEVGFHPDSLHSTQSYEHEFTSSGLPEQKLPQSGKDGFVYELPEPQGPFLHDPGNGIRVKDIHAFLASSLASPPSLDDEQCVQFAQPAVLSILLTMLPQEVALIIFHNKSRICARICPACRRLYAVGDWLQPHSFDTIATASDSPEVRREQIISGICSFVCFRAMSFNYPGAISAWGKMGYELDSDTRHLLNGPGEGVDDEGLGTLLKLTRIDDLGIGQVVYLTALSEQPVRPGQPVSETT